MTPMQAPPTQAAPPQAAPTQGLTAEDIQEIAQEVGKTPQQVAEDVRRTGATSREQLYPDFYSGAGIDPSAVRGAMGEEANPNEAEPDGDVDDQSTPNRAAAQAAMTGQQPQPQDNAGMSEAPEDPNAPPIPPTIAEALHRKMGPPRHHRVKPPMRRPGY